MSDSNANPARGARKTEARSCVLAAICAVAVGAITLSAQAQLHKANPCGDDPTAPCPQMLERLCTDASVTDASGSAGANLFCDCACGTGHWARSSEQTQLMPATEITDANSHQSINTTSWDYVRNASATRTHAQARVTVRGYSTFWHAASLTKSISASYSSTQREVWEGSGPPCPRLVELVATGGGLLEITLTCSAQPGCSATASASLSGSCASRGNASAYLDEKNLKGTVAYDSYTHKFSASGKLGIAISDDSVGVDGQISSQVSWELEGVGTASGTASYIVRPDRTYCAFTNRPITRLARGMVIAAGGATVDANGSAAFEALALVSLQVQ